MTFNYDSPAVPATTVADVALEITSHGKPQPLSDEEREQRRIKNELYRWECQQREEQRRIERERQQAEAEATARHEAAIALAENNRKARLERQDRINREVRERELADLRFQSARHQAWQRDVETAARIGLVQRQQRTLMGELERMLSPPHHRQSQRT